MKRFLTALSALFVIGTSTAVAGTIVKRGPGSGGSGTASVTGLTDDASCAPGEVIARDAGDTAFECVAAGAGDITAVGPYTSGAAFTGGVVSTGTTMFTWEGTTDDTAEYFVASPAADPASDLTWTFPTVTGTLSVGDPITANIDLSSLSAANVCSTIRTALTPFNDQTASVRLVIYGTANLTAESQLEDRGNYRNCFRIGDNNSAITRSSTYTLNIDFQNAIFNFTDAAQSEPVIFFQIGDSYSSYTEANTTYGTVSGNARLHGKLKINAVSDVDTGWGAGDIPSLPIHGPNGNATSLVGMIWDNVHYLDTSSFEYELISNISDRDNIGLIVRHAFSTDLGTYYIQGWGVGMLVLGANGGTTSNYGLLRQNNVGISYGDPFHTMELAFEKTGAITAFADGTPADGKVTVTSVGHGLTTGDYVTINRTTNYNTTDSSITVLTADTFEIDETWVSNDAAGQWVFGLFESTRGLVLNGGTYEGNLWGNIVYWGDSDGAVFKDLYIENGTMNRQSIILGAGVCSDNEHDPCVANADCAAGTCGIPQSVTTLTVHDLWLQGRIGQSSSASWPASISLGPAALQFESGAYGIRISGDLGRFTGTSVPLDFNSGATAIVQVDGAPNLDFDAYPYLVWGTEGGKFSYTSAGTPLSINVSLLSNTETLSNTGVGSTTVYNLPTPDVTIPPARLCRDGQILRVDPNAAGVKLVLPGQDLANDEYLEATSDGSCLTLVALSATEWLVTDVSGTWVSQTSGYIPASTATGVDANGAAAITIGSADVTTVTVTTDASGTNLTLGDGAGTLAGGVEIGGTADAPQVVIEGHSTQTDSVVIVQNDADTQVINLDVSGNVLAQSIQDIDGPGTSWTIDSSGNATFAGSATIGSPNGVSFTGDGDGAVTLLGLGDGSDENIVVNLDDTANTVGITSGTGVTSFNMGTIAVVSPAPIATSTGGALAINTITLATAAGDYDIPDNCDTATGAWVVLQVRDASETASITTTDTGDTFVYKGVATLVANDEMDSPGAAGDSVSFICLEADKWYMTATSGSWTDGGTAD